MGHWYRASGEPLYEVPRAKGGGMRPTTLADAKKLKLVPSVTTILSIIDKPFLNRWKTEQILKAVYDYPFQYGDMNWEHYKSSIYMNAEQETQKAAELGSKIHDALEKFYTTGTRGIGLELLSFITPVIELLTKTFNKDMDWISEASFGHSLGFGGKCDLHLLPCLEYPNGVILDFKTKSTENFSKVKAYDEHCMQLVAYREGFNLPNAECYNLFISAKERGKLKLHKWDEKECAKAWSSFKHLLEYWKIVNKVE